MQELVLKSETLYILSGPQGSGKSTFTSRLQLQRPAAFGGDRVPAPVGTALSADALRQQLFGVEHHTVDGAPAINPRDTGDNVVWSTILLAVRERMKERLTTVVDAQFLTDTERKEVAELALEAGMPVEVLIFDLPAAEIYRRNASRAKRVGKSFVDYSIGRFARTSSYPYQLLTGEDVEWVPVIVDRREISVDIGLDVISDSHGLFAKVLELIVKLGYTFNAAGVPVHPRGRRLLFLGDMVDRGPESMELLEFVRKCVEAGHYAIRGNHENKLLKFLSAHARKDLKQWNSAASAETGLKLLRMPAPEREKLVRFLKELPGYYVRGNQVFVHADIGRPFRPGEMALTECCYGLRGYGQGAAGSEVIDSDAVARAVNPSCTIIRGHFKEISEGEGTITVYDDGEYGGNLVALSLPEGELSREDLHKQYKGWFTRLATGFNYDEVIAKRSPLRRQLDQLVAQKLATRELDTQYGLTLYKYAGTVFYDNLWNQNAALNRARGIVFDIAGNIVQNPFTKVFNYGENGATVDDEEVVIAAPKLNGYLACISYHPVEADKLLVTTTGSFTSDFVKLADDIIKRKKAMGPLLRYLRNHPGRTLMFEVIDTAQDPHIVQYDQSAQGLWLIGARDSDEHALELTEAALDEIAATLGSCVHRAAWYRIKFGELRQKVAEMENDEGVMVRRDSEAQEVLLKLKGVWYLTTKFVGRMSEPNVRYMFGNPENFKKTKIDEEFFGLVDNLVAKVTVDTYLEMPKPARISLAASLLGY